MVSAMLVCTFRAPGPLLLLPVLLTNLTIAETGHLLFCISICFLAARMRSDWLTG